MDPRVHFITLGVPDLAAARAFYVAGLGWSPAFEVPGEVVFIQVGPGLLLSLFGADDLAADIGGGASGGGPGAGFTLAHNVDSDDEVRRLTEEAIAAGATVLKPPQRADFGGFHSYVADPAGVRWEICHNPGWSVADDGSVRIGPIGE